MQEHAGDDADAALEAAEAEAKEAAQAGAPASMGENGSSAVGTLCRALLGAMRSQHIALDKPLRWAGLAKKALPVLPQLLKDASDTNTPGLQSNALVRC